METTGLKLSLTLMTVFTLITGAMVGMAWATLPSDRLQCDDAG